MPTSIIKSKHTIAAPETNLLSYIFDAPYNDAGAWPATEPILVPANAASDCPGYTIDEIKSLVKRLGNGLHTIGARGKRVMVYGEANIHFPIAVLGAIAAGAAVNILAPSPAEYLVPRLRQLECDIVLLSPNQADIEAVGEAARELGISAKRLFMIDEKFKKPSTSAGGPETGPRHWGALLDIPGGDEYEWPRLSSTEAKNTTAVLSYTSGTTGTPKLACRTHHNLVGNIAQALHHDNLLPRTHEITSCVFKFAGMGFLLIGILIPLKARYRHIFLPGADVSSFTQMVERFRPTTVIAPPHVMRETLALLSSSSVRPDLSSVRHVHTGGGIISWDLVDTWQKAFGSRVLNTYAMTEGGIFTAPHPGEPVTDAATGILLPDIEAKIIDDNGAIAPRNQKGTVCIRTPFVMKGYLNKPAQTAETVTEDGWIITGDIGWIDERELVYVVGRWKDMFKIRNHEVTVSEIEAAASRHPAVQDVAVIPVVPQEGEEYVPRGYIVKKEGSDISADELISWMQQEFPPWIQLLGGAAFIDAIPIASTGNSKVDRRKLAEMAERELRVVNGEK
ncbi:uncharacterized protein BDV17DRAFT_51389 [Aspergillus undulatus]|uniref:uncharacterized protein n=1 Tax=Aspergillus undulatus TaxID=1810928 RepID=UPI003CCDCA7E